MIEGLIVAAGNSSRIPGQHKMLLDLGGKPLIQRTADSLLQVCDRLVLVTGCNSGQISEIFARCQAVDLVFNPDFQEGMFSSVKTGLPHIRSPRFFFLPGDCPFVARSVLVSLLAVDDPIVVPTYANQPGHPVLFNRSVIKQILDYQFICNLREFIRENNPREVAVESEEILMDVDTLTDYQFIAKKYVKNL